MHWVSVQLPSFWNLNGSSIRYTRVTSTTIFYLVNKETENRETPQNGNLLLKVHTFPIMTESSYNNQIWRASAMDPARLKTSKGALLPMAFTVCGHESVVQK